jgi:hypothetical protein
LTIQGADEPQIVDVSTLSVAPAAKFYGDDDPDFAIKDIPDGVTYHATFAREAGEGVGEYVVTVESLVLDKPDLLSGDDLSTITGTLTIDPRPVTFTVDSDTVEWTGEAVELPVSITAGSLVDGDDFDPKSVTVSETDSGTHDAVLKGVSIVTTATEADVTENYDTTLVNGQLTIGEAPTPVEFTPVIGGGTKLGTSLSVSDVPEGTAAYQWLRDNQPIDGATEATYTVASADLCHAITVRVTVTVDGAQPETGTSEALTPEFTDISATSSFSDAICWLANAGLASGSEDGSFHPNDKASRGDVAAMLYRAAGAPDMTSTTPQFTDVPKSSEFYQPIAWMVQQRITFGWGDGTFRPNDPVERGAVAAFLYRFAGSPAYTPTGPEPFKDLSPSSGFYKEIRWLQAQGAAFGYEVPGGMAFGSTELTNRGQLAAFLYRLNTAGKLGPQPAN